MKTATGRDKHVHTNRPGIPRSQQGQVLQIPPAYAGKGLGVVQLRKKHGFLFLFRTLYVFNEMPMGVCGEKVQAHVFSPAILHPELHGKVLTSLQQSFHHNTALLAQDASDPSLPVGVVRQHQSLATAAPWRLHDNRAPLREARQHVVKALATRCIDAKNTLHRHRASTTGKTA